MIALPKKTVVAHLGAHKTATSLVQNFFADKHGFYKWRGIDFISRRQISPMIGWGDKIVSEPCVLREMIDASLRKWWIRTAFFSNENSLGKPYGQGAGLYPRHAEIIPALGQALDGLNPRIIYSIRPQWDHLESYYLQRINQGDHFTFDEFLKTVDLKQLHWTPVIESFQNQFGKNNVVVLDFDVIQQGQDAFLAEFIKRSLSDWIKPDVEYEAVHNASLSARGLEIALRINPLLEASETGTVRKFLQANFSNLSEPRPSLLSETQREYLKDLYADEYAVLTAQPLSDH